MGVPEPFRKKNRFRVDRISERIFFYSLPLEVNWLLGRGDGEPQNYSFPVICLVINSLKYPGSQADVNKISESPILDDKDSQTLENSPLGVFTPMFFNLVTLELWGKFAKFQTSTFPAFRVDDVSNEASDDLIQISLPRVFDIQVGKPYHLSGGFIFFPWKKT